MGLDSGFGITMVCPEHDRLVVRPLPELLAPAASALSESSTSGENWEVLQEAAFGVQDLGG